MLRLVFVGEVDSFRVWLDVFEEISDQQLTEFSPYLWRERLIEETKVV